MKFGTITQTGLELSSDIGMFPAQYSANIQIDVEIDSAYQDYTPTANVGYPSGGPVYLNTSLAIEDGVLTIEPVCFKNDGVLVISLAFTKENEVIVTHPVNIPIVGAPGASIILPPSDIWQQQVSAFVQSYLKTEGIAISATAVTGEPGTEAKVENTGTGTKPVFKFTIPQGEQGDSVGSIHRTSGTGAAGTTDTYTIYNDDGETIGTFTVYNGANGDGSGDFMANGSVPMTGHLDMGRHQIHNLAAPTSSTDAATMGTVEAFVIKETDAGDIISVSDSADYRLLGLKLYGKSVQDGELPPNNQPNDPLPTTPVPIENAGDSGSIVTTICGTNLLDFSGAVGGTFGGIKAALTGDGGYVMTGTANTPTINIWFLGNYSGGINVFTLYPGTYTCKNVILYYGQSGVTTASNVLPNVPYTFKISTNTVITGVRCVSAVADTTYNETLYPILARGNSLPEWEPYKSQTFMLPTPNSLRAIPVDSDGEYTDEGGQKWIGDYADLTAKKLVTKIARVDAASFVKNNVMPGTRGSRFSFTPSESSMNGSKALCNYLAYRYTNSYGAAGNYVSTDENKVNIRLTEDITLEEFRRKYSDLYVLYQLETPVESDIVGAQDFSGYKPNTTITTDSDPASGVEVNYVADTKTYIDNKIAAISNLHRDELDVLAKLEDLDRRVAALEAGESGGREEPV